jgi:tetratricopeptide (TPR) repeat protein
LFEEHWFTPNLANVFGLSSSFWTLLPALLLLLAVLFVAWRCTRRPARFSIGVLLGILLVGVYLGLPNLDHAENVFRRAAIAERFFVPADRLEKFKTTGDWQTLQRINVYEWMIADARAAAPDDFPYLETRPLNVSPSALARRADELQRQGRTAEAENILQQGKTDFPFARCEMATNLAVVYENAGRRDEALRELESIRNTVSRASRPECLRSQFLLGSLYRENGRSEDAQQTFDAFLVNSENSTDPEISSLRRHLGVR